MTIFQQSMLYALLAGIGRLWRESCLGRGFAALVRWLSARVDESAILWVLCREGEVARAWEESFLCLRGCLLARRISSLDGGF